MNGASKYIFILLYIWRYILQSAMSETRSPNCAILSYRHTDERRDSDIVIYDGSQTPIIDTLPGHDDTGLNHSCQQPNPYLGLHLT